MKRHILTILALLIISSVSYAQRTAGYREIDLDDNAGNKTYLTALQGSLGVNSSDLLPNPCALLDLSSVTKGVLLPRMATGQINALCPIPGMLAFNTTTNVFQYWNGGSWATLISSGTWQLTGNDNVNVDGVDNILGTKNTSALFPYQFIVGGQRIMRYETGNRIIGGDVGNTSLAVNSVIAGGGVGGFINSIADGVSAFSFIGGGADNVITNSNSGVIVGGAYNRTNNVAAIVVGGSGNTASGDGSFVGGGNNGLNTPGSNNTASGLNSTVVAGRSNRATDDYGFVGGGWNNQAGDNAGTTSDVQFATVSGGVSNFATGSASFIGGGFTNLASGTRSAVAGGSTNTASGTNSYVGGGESNTVLGLRSVIGGGWSNVINSPFSTIGGGNSNFVNGDYATVAGGTYNTAIGIYTTIGGGNSNAIATDNATIAGGNDNEVFALGNGSFIGGGAANKANAINNVIAGGYNHTNNGQDAFIGAGHTNIINTGAFQSVIAGGISNTIAATGVRSVIGGGESNTASGTYSTVGGGISNNASGSRSTIAGGDNNIASNSDATVAGGAYNRATAIDATVGGGSYNTVGGNWSVIPGGNGMTVNGQSSFGFLGSGVPSHNQMTISTANTAAFGNVHMWLANNNNTASQLRFYEPNVTAGAFPPAGINYTAFRAGIQAADISYVLPLTSVAGVMVNDGASNMSWSNTPTLAGLTLNGGTNNILVVNGTADATALSIGANPVWDVRINGDLHVSGVVKFGGSIVTDAVTPNNHSILANDDLTIGTTVAGDNFTLQAIAPGSININGNTSFNGDLNMNNFRILNIGNANTDFGPNGSLTLNDSLIVLNRGGKFFANSTTGFTGSDAVYGQQTGTNFLGSAGFFENTNAGNSTPAVVAKTFGTGPALQLSSSTVAMNVTSGSLRASAAAGSQFAETVTIAGGAATQVINNTLAQASSTIIITFQGTAARALALGPLVITARAAGNFTIGNANGINFANTDIIHYMIINH